MTDPWGLTTRERQSVAAMARGNYKRASDELSLSPRTVEVYIRRAKRKMGAENLIACVLQYDRWARSQ